MQVYFNLLTQKKDDKLTLQEKGTANKKLTKFLISKIIACINWWTTFLFINLNTMIPLPTIFVTPYFIKPKANLGYTCRKPNLYNSIKVILNWRERKISIQCFGILFYVVRKFLVQFGIKIKKKPVNRNQKISVRITVILLHSSLPVQLYCTLRRPQSTSDLCL